MSHPEQDQTAHWINEVAATMGGSGTAESVPGAIGNIVFTEALPYTEVEEGSVYRGLADELLLETGRTVPVTVRDALARHIGANLVAALGQTDYKQEADPSPRVLDEVRSGLRDGGLLAEIEQAAVADVEDQKATVSGPIARWRHARRATAARAAEERARYTRRQEELKRDRVQTLAREYMDTDRLKTGDVVAFEMKSHRKDSNRARSTLKAVVSECHSSEDGKDPCVVLRVIEENRGDTGGAFLHDPLPSGATIVVPGTSYPNNGFTPKPGRISRNQALEITWEGQPMPLLANTRIVEGPRVMPKIPQPLHLHQLTVNEVVMFSDEW